MKTIEKLEMTKDFKELEESGIMCEEELGLYKKAASLVNSIDPSKIIPKFEELRKEWIKAL